MALNKYTRTRTHTGTADNNNNNSYNHSSSNISRRKSIWSAHTHTPQLLAWQQQSPFNCVCVCTALTPAKCSVHIRRPQIICEGWAYAVARGTWEQITKKGLKFCVHVMSSSRTTLESCAPSPLNLLLVPPNTHTRVYTLQVHTSLLRSNFILRRARWRGECQH